MAANAKAIVWRSGGKANLDGVFVYHVAVGFGIALVVVHVPAERCEHRVNEIASDLGFVVLPVAVGVEIPLEVFDQGENGLRGGHGLILGFVVAAQASSSNDRKRHFFIISAQSLGDDR